MQSQETRASLILQAAEWHYSFNPSYTLTVKQVSVKPPLSCDALAVVDTRDGHCWVIVYLPYPVADDTEQLCK